MNWKFWTSDFWTAKSRLLEAQKVGSDLARMILVAEAEAQERIRKKAEWDALPDHRKAARIEYRIYQRMTRPKNLKFANCKVIPGSSAWLGDMAQQQALGALTGGTGSWSSPYQQYLPHGQMDQTIARALHLERGGFDR